MRLTNIILLFGLLSLTACSVTSNEEIAKIPEASGICFSDNSKTLFIANDEGSVYEMSKSGEILRTQYLGDFDLEGVACNDKKHELNFAYEGEDSIIRVNTKTLKVISVHPIKRSFQGYLLLEKDKKHGLEGITFIDNNVLLSNQSYHLKPMTDPSVVVVIKAEKTIAKYTKYNKGEQSIDHFFQPLHVDISGLDYHDNALFMVSDTEDLLIKYDIKKQVDIMTVKLPPYAQEGIAFDDENNIYIANDNGSIFKYKNNKWDL